MKIIVLLLYICITQSATKSLPEVIHAPFDVISLDDITLEERKQLAKFEQQLRLKRSGSPSGSGDIIGAIAKALGQGIKKKIGQVATASASASAGFSKGSSSGSGDKSYSYHHPPHHYDHDYDTHEYHPHESKSIDWWTLKKSILNTLLQAVKAIKGGVIAIKGQIIKGSGKLISGSGKLISSKGEEITTLGKNIATSALLVSPGGHSGHGDYASSAPSAPEEIYHSSPSAPGPEYLPHDHYPPHYGVSYHQQYYYQDFDPYFA